ncbi:cell wall-binding repeat-containing protein [Herbiconiux sp. KACC 21604]|uniref:cell wall-binding repeat-containing protein n=1 Tax=Herbiconiux sp. KACC 21604 TaxID=3092664 RepID=UPI00388DA4C8|nr:cell wall-binding repeat-containing protein [Herbiconiux sp. KACC 21604]
MSLSVGTAALLASGLVALPAHATNFIVATIPITSSSRPDPAPVAIAIDGESGQAYVANTFDGTVSVIDTTTNAVSTTIPHGPASIGNGPTAVAVDEAGRKAYVVNYNSDSVSVVDVVTNRVIRVIPHDVARGIGSHPSSIALDTVLRRAYVTNLADGTVSVIDTTTDSVIAVVPHDSASGIGSFLTGVAVDQQLHRAYVANNMDGTVSVIDTQTNSVIAVIPHDSTNGIGSGPRGVAVDTPTHRAFVTNSDDDTLSVIDTQTNRVIAVLPHDEANGITNGSWTVTVDSDGGQVLVASKTRITAIDISTLRITRLIDRSSSADYGYGVQGMAVHPKTRLLYVTGAVSNTVAVVDADTTAPVARISGSDRYESAARVSQREFASGADLVYVASGATFPDALAGSAAAGSRGASVLLVTRDSIPTATGAELARLRPKKIVVLGGTATISDSVLRSLASYAPTTRLAGSDRYAVSAAVSAETFPTGTATAYIASGEVFPDALSGGAVAGATKAPVLLVTRDGIPEPVRAELERLKPGRIIVVGGENTISTTTAAALAGMAPTTRIGGVDRYAASAAISAAAYPSGSRAVFVASGATFPDALSGGSAAAANSAPILLVKPDEVPTSIAAEIRRLGATRIIVLGGENSVSRTTLESLRALLH